MEETARRGYDDEIREILQIVHGYEEKYACTIPVVFAGGVYTHEDILHYLSLGCAGVQMATVSLSRKNAMPIRATSRHT